MGCVKTMMPIRPVKPMIQMNETDDGGVYFDKYNSYLLFKYILELEHGYKAF